VSSCFFFFFSFISFAVDTVIYTSGTNIKIQNIVIQSKSAVIMIWINENCRSVPLAARSSLNEIYV